MKNLTLLDKTFILKKIPLFSNLDIDALLPIADKCEQISLKEGEKVFWKGEKGKQMYFVVEGKISIYDHDNNKFYKLTNQDFFGDEALFHEKPRKYEAVCHTDCHLLALSKPHLFTIISEFPSVAINFLSVYSKSINFRG